MLLAAVAAVAPARASPDSSADPQLPFDEGRALMRAGRFAEAAQKFEESLAIRGTTGAWLNLGDCLEKLGRYASAVERFEQARALSAGAGDTVRAEEARARAEALRPIVSRVVVRDPAVPGRTVLLDGRSVSTGQPIAVDGGNHRVTVTAPCRTTFELTVAIGIRGDTREIKPVLAPREDPACPTSAAHEDAGSSWWTPRHWAVVGFAAAGTVALVLGGVEGLGAVSSKNDLHTLCPSYPHQCPASAQPLIDDAEATAEKRARSATVSLVAAGVLLAGAAVLLLTEPKASTAAALRAARGEFSF
jgi:hypothetical protein